MVAIDHPSQYNTILQTPCPRRMHHISNPHALDSNQAHTSADDSSCTGSCPSTHTCSRNGVAVEMTVAVPRAMHYMITAAPPAGAE